jgi:putative ABC transport system ATP-binding protein/lipoprotein-releasing system ATP-binding protein
MTILASHVTKHFGEPPVAALTDISLDIGDGEFVSLTGRSGSGKSTLLYVLSSLDNPTTGSVDIDGIDLASMSSDALCRFRNTRMGFIFQFHYLLAELTVLENVLMPARKFQQEQSRRSYAESLLAQFGLADKGTRLPRQLSGGEQQRVAIARALVMQPRYLFADEPTGSLDTANGDLVMDILRQINSAYRTAVILVTHDPDFAALAQRQIRLIDGRIESIEVVPGSPRAPALSVPRQSVST